MTIQLNATERYYPVMMVVVLVMLYKVVLAFESLDEIPSVTIHMKDVEE